MLCEMRPSVLLVEDDERIAIPLIRTLEREDYTVEHVTHGEVAMEQVGGSAFDLVLLDLGLPDMDGLEVCRRMREDGYRGGVIILTARGGELDRVVGLDVGADDYLAKPFALAELLARTRALLRRTGQAPGEVPTPAAATPAPPGTGLSLDTDARRVWLDGEELPVTAKEFDVLALLDRQRGAVLTRERLMSEAWDENWFGSTKPLDAAVGRLRQKLEDRGSRARIVTVRGVGFRLEDGPPDA